MQGIFRWFCRRVLSASFFSVYVICAWGGTSVCHAVQKGPVRASLSSGKGGDTSSKGAESHGGACIKSTAGGQSVSGQKGVVRAQLPPSMGKGGGASSTYPGFSGTTKPPLMFPMGFPPDGMGGQGQSQGQGGGVVGKTYVAAPSAFPMVPENDDGTGEVVEETILKENTDRLTLHVDKATISVRGHNEPFFLVRMRVRKFPSGQAVVIRKTSEGRNLLISSMLSKKGEPAGAFSSNVVMEIAAPLATTVRIAGEAVRLSVTHMLGDFLLSIGELFLESDAAVPLRSIKGTLGRAMLRIGSIRGDLKLLCGYGDIIAHFDMQAYLESRRKNGLSLMAPSMISIRQGSGNAFLTFPQEAQIAYLPTQSVRASFPPRRLRYDASVFFNVPPCTGELTIQKRTFTAPPMPFLPLDSPQKDMPLETPLKESPPQIPIPEKKPEPAKKAKKKR